MTELAAGARRITTTTQPTGPVGRFARLVLAVALSASVYSLVDQGGLVAFRNPSVPTEVMVWILTAAMVASFAALVGALAAAAGSSWPRRWQLGAVGLFVAAGAAAALIGWTTSGALWGFPLADLVWWFDLLMLLQIIVALLIAIGLGTPGCEVGVWPALAARARGTASEPGAGLACIVGLHFIDAWEVDMRQANAEATPGRDGESDQ